MKTNLMKKAVAAAVCACMTLTLGPVPQALAQVQTAAQSRPGAVLPTDGQQAPTLAPEAGSLAPDFAGVTMTTTPNLLEIPAAANTATTPGAVFNATIPHAVAAPEKAASGRKDPPAPEPARNELSDVRDAVSSLPSMTEAAPGQAYSSGRDLADLITRQKARGTQADADVSAAQDEVFGQRIRHPLAAAQDIVPTRLGQATPSPRRASAAKRSRLFSLSGLAVMAGFIALQAYVPAILSGLGLLFMTGTTGDEDPERADMLEALKQLRDEEAAAKPARRLASGLKDIQPTLEAAGIAGAGLGLSLLLNMSLHVAWLSGVIGMGAAVAGYAAFKIARLSAPGASAGSWSLASFIDGLRPAAKKAAIAGLGAGAAGLLYLSATVSAAWLAVPLAMAAVAAGFVALKPGEASSLLGLKSLAARGVAGTVGLGLALALQLGLGLAPWLAGFIGMGAAIAAVALPPLFAQLGADGPKNAASILNLKSLAERGSVAAAGAAAVMLFHLSLGLASPWLSLALSVGAALTAVAAVALPSEGSWKASAIFNPHSLIRGASLAAIGFSLAWILTGLMAPWLAGLLAVGALAGAFSALKLRVLPETKAETSAPAWEGALGALDPAEYAMAPDPELLPRIQHGGELLRRMKAEIARAIVGQEEAIEYMLLTTVAGGHMLLESVPGLAKTAMVRAFAESLGVDYQRIQGTPDLMPDDIRGIDLPIKDPATGQITFELKQGPVFTMILLMDEINRMPEKTQAALLEAMQEGQVTVGGKTYKLPQPFVVLATQNPIEQAGTYRLTEANLDRFMFKVILPHPTDEQLAEIMKRYADKTKPMVTKVAGISELMTLRELADKVRMDPRIDDYIVRLLRATHDPALYEADGRDDVVKPGGGASPRAAIILRNASRVRAMMQGRDYVTPDDVRALAPEVLRHRIRISDHIDDLTVDQLVRKILNKVPIDRQQAAVIRARTEARRQRNLAAEAQKNAPPTGLRRWSRLAWNVLFNKWTLLLAAVAVPAGIWLAWPTLVAHFPALGDWLGQALHWLQQTKEKIPG